MDFAARPENIRGHSGVPETRLVSKVDASFQHLTHGYGHTFSFLSGLSHHSPTYARLEKLPGTLDQVSVRNLARRLQMGNLTPDTPLYFPAPC